MTAGWKGAEMHVSNAGNVAYCVAHAFLLGAAGCTFAEHDPDVGGRTAAIIEADYEDVTLPYEFPAVIRVPNCTGTLISPSHVLTAAHCVADGAPQEVQFVARDTDITVDNTFLVAECAMNPGFTRANVDLVRSEFRIGTTTEILDRLGERCGVLTLRGSFGDSSDTPFDFAVLTLARPVPHPVDDPTTIGAGVVFVTPERIVDTPAPSSESFSAAAVGFGGVIAMTSRDSGTRRVKRFSERISSGVVTRAGVLGEQDSGGPLFLEDAGDRVVVGVASTADSWGVFDDIFNLEWVRRHVDSDDDRRADVMCPRGRRGSDPTAVADNDGDGDGVLDAEDTCPNTYNPCQESTDIDGDGIPDDCDACPADSGMTAFRGDGTLADSDADGVADVCDCHVAMYDAPADLDYDFVRFACDNCNGVFNPFQENADGECQGCCRVFHHAAARA